MEAVFTAMDLSTATAAVVAALVIAVGIHLAFKAQNLSARAIRRA